MNWLDDDLACRTVADRVAMYKKFLGKEFATYNLQHERVRRIVDRDGDGRADVATVFADGFNDPAAGIGAGVLRARTTSGSPVFPGSGSSATPTATAGPTTARSCTKATAFTSASWATTCTACGSGPTAGSISASATAGFNVTTREGQQLAVPDTGSVLRCNPDGTELEVFATGLRNPQELAFDEYGNLFTGDNNSDSGDRARWVYLVEGGDSGWRIGYQFIESPNSRGPWNEEKLWYPAFAGQAAYIVPPIANIADGPSGLTYDPGVTLLPRPVQEPLLPGRLPRFQRSERDSHLLARSPRERRSSSSIPGNSSGRCWRPTPTSGPTGRSISATGSRAGK